jgi:hypothetical protein
VKCSTCFAWASLTLALAALPAFAQPSSTAPSSAPAAAPAEAPAAPSSTAASTTTAAATPAPPAAADKSEPSADDIKKAKSFGMHAETRRGQTVYCWEDTSLGSRFPDKKCIGANDLNSYIVQREATQQEMRQLKTGTGAK